jgi:WD40 repeat protein
VAVQTYRGQEIVLELWDASSGDLIANVASGHPALGRALRISPDGRWIGQTMQFGFKLYDLTNPSAPPRRLSAPSLVQGADLYALAFSPDSREVSVAGTGGVIESWEIASGRRLSATVTGHTWIRALAYHPNGKMIAANVDHAVNGMPQGWRIKLFRRTGGAP